MEKVLYDLEILTCNSKESIVQHIESIACSYNDAKEFAVIFRRLPNAKEAYAINLIGVYGFIRMLGFS